MSFEASATDPDNMMSSIYCQDLFHLEEENMKDAFCTLKSPNLAKCKKNTSAIQDLLSSEVSMISKKETHAIYGIEVLGAFNTEHTQ